MANATGYGLSAGVITNDMQKALDLAFGLKPNSNATCVTAALLVSSRLVGS